MRSFPPPKAPRTRSSGAPWEAALTSLPSNACFPAEVQSKPCFRPLCDGVSLEGDPQYLPVDPWQTLNTSALEQLSRRDLEPASGWTAGLDVPPGSCPLRLNSVMPEAVVCPLSFRRQPRHPAAGGGATTRTARDR